MACRRRPEKDATMKEILVIEDEPEMRRNLTTILVSLVCMARQSLLRQH